ncbi:MAG TPA: CHASE3 domain-containing protein [Tepidisphaeraceae bacterium]|nr:CHASE3 domain-containing protein [Tepidisphaeraceae bacterium]
MSAIPTAASFKQLIISALLVPMGLMICIAVILAFQIKGLMDTAIAVERSDRILAQVNALEKLTLDMETGVRGYLLTGNEAFTSPFDIARSQIEAETQQLRDLLSDRPEELERLNRIVGLRAQWLAFAHEVLSARRGGQDYMTIVNSLRGKGFMDASRVEFAEFIKLEEARRDVLSSAAHQSTRNTLLLLGAVSLLGGGVLAWLARKQFLALGNTYRQALVEAQELNATLEQRVTDRTALLEKRSAQLTEANRELEAFGYSISHDLRAPMRHISGFADLVRRSAGPKMDPDDLESLTTIYDTAKNAGRMVDDLLSFSRIGRAQLRKEPVDMDALLSQVLRDLKPETNDRQIDWTIGHLPPSVGDSALLRMVLHNLVSNAVKYTGKTREARIQVGASTDGPETVYFVTDNGTGFDMKYANKLFGVFQRLHRAEEFEGTGIGLANVRRIIMRHGGRVWADAKLGEGATFSFTIPKLPSDGTDDDTR